MAEEFNNKQVFLKKLIYRSKYTGTKETDLLLGKFSDIHLPKLSFKDLLAYKKLLDSGDPRIWRLSINIDKSYDKKEEELIHLIKKFTDK